MNKYYKKLYEDLVKEFEEYKETSIKWSWEDFFYLEMVGYSITEEQCKNALKRMIRKHDANNGICWLDLEFYIREYGTEVEPGQEHWRQFNNV